MDNKLNLSIVIPVYNVEDYLEEALESVSAQTMDKIEFICVNDGSTDSSPEILKRFSERDSRFRIISQENGGYGKAVNHGLDEAQGKYVAIFEPDDLVPPYMYERLFSVAEENKVDLIKADFYRFTTDDVTGEYRYRYMLLDYSLKRYNKVLNVKTDPYALTLAMYTWSGIYNTDFINRNNIRHNETPGASYQDNGFFWKTFMHADRMMFLNEPLYNYRVDNPNASIKSKGKVYCMNYEHKLIKQYIEDNFEKSIVDPVKPYFIVRQFNAYMETLRRIDKSFKREYVYEISDEFKKEYDEGYDFGKLNNKQKTRMLLLVDDPEEYYRKYHEDTGEKVKRSVTFKIGRIFTFLPGKIKRTIYRTPIQDDGLEEE